MTGRQLPAATLRVLAPNRQAPSRRSRVNTVLQDLAPVLKRVAGDDIELVLPQKVSALNVDVEADRVERVLINVAARDAHECRPVAG